MAHSKYVKELKQEKIKIVAFTEFIQLKATTKDIWQDQL